MSNEAFGYKMLFTGFFVDEDTFTFVTKNEARPQHAAYRHQKSLINMLIALPWGSFDIIGSTPCSTYPNNRILVHKAKKWRMNSLSGYVVPFINLPVFRGVSRSISFLFLMINWLIFNETDKSKKPIIFQYALHTPHLLPAYVMKLLFGVKLILYIPDLPLYMNPGGNVSIIKRMLKRVDSAILLFLANKVDGRVFITEGMADYLNVDSSLVIDSISNKDKNAERLVKNEPDIKNVVYTGGLNEAYGIRKLVMCFADERINKLGLRLVLCGSGPLRKWCTMMAEQYDNIYYYGVVSNHVATEIQENAYILINLRDNASEYTNYSFPSKIAEYMQAGVPIITTNLKGIPSDLCQFLNFVNDDPVDAILDVANHYKERKAQAINGRDYYVSSREPYVQAQKFMKYLDNIK